MYCTKCGTLAKEGDYYCRKCGAVVDHDGLDQVTSFPPVRRDSFAVPADAEIPAPGDETKNWMAWLSLLLSVAGLLLFFTVLPGFFAGMLGIFFGIYARKSQRKKTAAAGLIISIIAVTCSVATGVLFIYYMRSFAADPTAIIYGIERIFDLPYLF